MKNAFFFRGGVCIHHLGYQKNRIFSSKRFFSFSFVDQKKSFLRCDHRSVCVQRSVWNDDSGTTFEKRVFSKRLYPFGVDKYVLLHGDDDDDDIAEGGGASQSARDFEPLFFRR